MVGVEDLDVADGLDVAGGDDARPCLRTTMRFGPSPCILMAISLMLRTMSVTSSRTPADRGELVQHAVDLHRLHRRALERGQKDAAERVAEGQAEAALERLGDDGREALACESDPVEISSLFGLISSCQFFWITSFVLSVVRPP